MCYGVVGADADEPSSKVWQKESDIFEATSWGDGSSVPMFKVQASSILNRKSSDRPLSSWKYEFNVHNHTWSSFLKMWNQMKLDLHIIWFINYSPRFTNYNNFVYTPNQGPMFSSCAYKPNKDFTHCKTKNKMRLIHWGYIHYVYLVNT